MKVRTLISLIFVVVVLQPDKLLQAQIQLLLLLQFRGNC